MKSLTFLFAFLFLSISHASPIDDAVAEYTSVVEISPITYKNTPVFANPLAICVFLGYKVALNSSKYTLNKTEKFYHFKKGDGETYEFELVTDHNIYSWSALSSVTCAKYIQFIRFGEAV